MSHYRSVNRFLMYKFTIGGRAGRRDDGQAVCNVHEYNNYVCHAALWIVCVRLRKGRAREGNWTHNHHINWVQLLAFTAQTNWDKIYVFVDNSSVKCLSFLGYFLKASRLFAGAGTYRIVYSRVIFLLFIITCQGCTHASPQMQWITIAANPPQRGRVSGAFLPALMHLWEHKRSDSIIERFVCYKSGSGYCWQQNHTLHAHMVPLNHAVITAH